MSWLESRLVAGRKRRRCVVSHLGIGIPWNSVKCLYVGMYVYRYLPSQYFVPTTYTYHYFVGADRTTYVCRYLVLPITDSLILTNVLQELCPAVSTAWTLQLVGLLT